MKRVDPSSPKHRAIEDVQTRCILAVLDARQHMDPTLDERGKLEVAIAGLSIALCHLVVTSVDPEHRAVALASILDYLPKALVIAESVETGAGVQ